MCKKNNEAKEERKKVRPPYPFYPSEIFMFGPCGDGSASHQTAQFCVTSPATFTATMSDMI